MRWLVTGVNRGIGNAIAKRVLSMGHQLIGIARKNYESLKELEKFGDFQAIFADLRNEEDIKNAASGILGKVDVLINNAGILIRESYPNFSQRDFLETMKVNVFAPLLLVAELERRGILSEGSKVVNISSDLGSISSASFTPSYSYSISKAALNMVTKLLSSELRSRGIVVISVHPGWVRTDMGGPSAPVLPAESAKGIVELAMRVTMEDSGKFFDYTGREKAW